MTASATQTTSDDAAGRMPAPPARLNRLATAVPAAAPEAPALPPLSDFLGTEDHRLRDLLAYGSTVEAGRLGPDGIEGARRKAEADLQAHAFRTLHNQVETIRLEAAAEQASRMARPMSFARAVLANIVALVIVAALAGAAVALDPDLPARLAAGIAQIARGG
jgi:hypothetical protein